MAELLALPPLRTNAGAFPALAVGHGVVPLEHPSQPPDAAGWWVELLGGYVPRSPEARLMRERLGRVYDLDAYLRDELAILRALPGSVAKAVLHAHTEDGVPLAGCRVAFHAGYHRADAPLEALCTRLTGLRHVREIGASITGRLV
jgi:hypothetical protein